MEISVQRATPALLDAVMADIREGDLASAYALGGDPKELIEYTMKLTREPEVGLIDGRPVAMFGLYEPGVISARGMPWFISTNAVDKYGLVVLKCSKMVVNHWQAQYDVLSTYILSSYSKSRRWAEWLGFKEIQDVELHPGGVFTYYERRL